MLKKTLAAVLAALTLLSLTACGGSQSSSQPQEGGKELKEITFVLDWTPNTNHTGLYTAQEMGFYEEAGLKVNIVQPPEDGASVLVASGRAQLGITCQDTMAPALIGENPLPIKAVAALLQHNTSGIISMKDKGIASPAGMAGKVYATWENPVEQATLKAVVEKDGAKWEDVQLVPSTPTDILSAIQTNVDAVWIFYGWDGIAAKVKGMDVNYWNFADIDPVFDYYTPVIIAGEEFLANEPETAKAFLAATAKGYEYAVEHPAESAEFLLKAAPELDRDICLASQEWLSTQYKAEVEQWGYIDPVRWDGFYTWLTENGLVESPLLPGTGYTNEFLS